MDIWEDAAGRLLQAWACTALGDFAQVHTLLAAPPADAWARSHAEALLGGLAHAEHRFADAVTHLTRAADAAHQLGFAAAEALHLANLGRAQQQNGDPRNALVTLEQSAATARSVGDLRGEAFARTRRARVLRALNRPDEARADLRTARAWYATAGGGDGDLLSAVLAAALDDDRPSLDQVRVAAKAAGDYEAELLALDALSRIHAAAGDHRTASALAADADALLPAVGHLITQADRVDRLLAAHGDEKMHDH